MEAAPLIAIPSFPGSNGEVDNMKTLRRCGFDCFVFRWNDSLEKLKDVDGYFFGAGFSYEDRGRAGMVAARDPLFKFMEKEAQVGKVIVGNCNGAQVLIESGLVPLGDGLRMSLARNAIRDGDRDISPGFLNEWVWVKRVCKKDRCATADWDGAMHMPMAHGEGRFVTKEPELIKALEENDQVAFRYCDAQGNVSMDPLVTPNGSTGAIAGICSPAGNVVALMPHPERSPLGDPYFVSIKQWILRKKDFRNAVQSAKKNLFASIGKHKAADIEIFIDTIITNNEERTVEQAARRVVGDLLLKQYRYIAPTLRSLESVLTDLTVFNPNKEIAYVRQGEQFKKWNADKKKLEATDYTVLKGISLLRRDEPDVGAPSFGQGSATGICYDCRNVDDGVLLKTDLLEVFVNPHAGTLERIAA